MELGKECIFPEVPRTKHVTALSHCVAAPSHLAAPGRRSHATKCTDNVRGISAALVRSDGARCLQRLQVLIYWLEQNLQMETGMLSREDFSRAAIDYHSTRHMELVKRGKAEEGMRRTFSCFRSEQTVYSPCRHLSSRVSIPSSLPFLHQAKSNNPSLDDSWDALGFAFGTLGRGGGLDRCRETGAA
eukprot:768432-Hanusia_phi.AAC.12